MLTKIRRYPSIRSFHRNEQQLFIGRETETQQLFNKVINEKITLIFARSGIGKSSLINAGLIPLLEKRGLLPIELRLQSTTGKTTNNECSLTAVELLKEVLAPYFDADIHKTALERIRSLTPDYKPALWEYFKCCTFPLSSIPVLILDQFEQFFTFPRIVQDEFMQSVNEILKDDIPLRFLELYSMLDNDVDKAMYRFWLEESEVKIIFAIRSDKIFELNRLTSHLPAILRNRFELYPLGKEEAARAIQMPAKINNEEIYTTKSFQYHPDLLEKILQSLSGNNDIIEATQLQIVCSEIETKIIGRVDEQTNGNTERNEKLYQVKEEDLAHIGGIEKIVSNFYQNQIAEFLTQKEQELARILIEDNMYDKDSRLRKILFEKIVRNILRKAKNALSIPQVNEDAILAKLLDLRLIREDHREGIKFYEISHDYLLGAIEESFDERERKRLILQNAALEKEKAKLEDANERANVAEKAAVQKQEEAQMAYLHIKDLQEKTTKAYDLAKTLYEKSRRTQNILRILIGVILVAAIVIFFIQKEQRKKENKLIAENYIYLGQDSYESFDYDRAFELFQKADSLGDSAGIYNIANGIFSPVYGSVIKYSIDSGFCVPITRSDKAAVWKISNQHLKYLFPLGDSVADACFSPHNKYVVIEKDSLGLQIWDISKGKPISFILSGDKKDRSLTSIKVKLDRFDNIRGKVLFSTNEQYALLYDSEEDKNGCLIDLRGGIIHRFSDILNKEFAKGLLIRGTHVYFRGGFSADGSVLAIHQMTKKDRSLQALLLYDLAEKNILNRHQNLVTYSFAPNGPFILTLNKNGILSVTNYRTKQSMLTASGLQNVAYDFKIPGSNVISLFGQTYDHYNLIAILDYNKFTLDRHVGNCSLDLDELMTLIEKGIIIKSSYNEPGKESVLVYNFPERDSIALSTGEKDKIVIDHSSKKLYYLGDDSSLHIVSTRSLKEINQFKTGIGKLDNLNISIDGNLAFIEHDTSITVLNIANRSVTSFKRNDVTISQTVFGGLLEVRKREESTNNSYSSQRYSAYMLVTPEYLKLNKEEKLLYLKGVYKKK